MILVPVATNQAFSAINDTSTIVIVGTVHSRTEKFTSESLYNIIERIKPDLILIELDSTFFTPEMSIKAESQQVSLENTVVTDYQKANSVKIRPYDIEGRNKTYRDNKYFEQQQELSKVLNQAIQDNLIQGEPKMLLEAIVRFDQITQAFALESPNIINSNVCNVAMDSKQYYANEGMVKIVTSIPVLKQFIPFATFKRDFWIRRNDVMVNKILNWNKLLQPKTILVLCGFEHKHYLYNSLIKQSVSQRFKLREYWMY